ncbi:MAG: hypothetical protein AAF656_08225 [Planctomycetota bacterium]
MRYLPALLLTFLLTAPAFAQNALDRRLPRIEFNDVPLVEVIDFMRDVTGINIVVQWNAIELIGIDRNTPVNLKVANVRTRQVLTLILRDAGQGELTYFIDENVLTITSRDEAAKVMVTKVYDIRDLLAPVPNFVPPDDFLGGGGGNNGGGGGGGGFAGAGGDFGDNGDQMSPEDMAELIIDIIRETVRPDVWQENGGFASIRYFDGTLIITAPPDVHVLIGG